MIDKDELKEKVSESVGRITRWAKALAGFLTEAAKAIGSLFVATFPWSLLVVAVVALGIFFAYLTYHGTSETEKQAEDARTNTIVEDASTAVESNRVANAERVVEQTEKTSQNARKERERAKQTNTSNTSYAQANAERCKTFPESAECK